MKVWKRSLPVWLLTLVMLLTACGTPSQPDQMDGTETWREVYEAVSYTHLTLPTTQAV